MNNHEIEIQTLVQLLEKADKQYYVDDDPELSEDEYMVLAKKYYNLTGEKWEAIGDVSSTLQRVKHKYSIKSLDKKDTKGELKEQLVKLAPGVIQPKYDGLTIVKQGEQFLTRGNGIDGEDVTISLSRILPMNVPFDYRAEVYIARDKFKDLNIKKEEQGEKLFKNARNTSAGICRQKKPSPDLRYLEYTAYNVLGQEQLTVSEQIDLLEKYKVVTPDKKYTFKYTKDNIDEAMDFVLNFPREELPYDIDGLVIKSDIPNSLQLFGETVHHPKNAIAYKFPSQGKWTTLKNIVWQTGRTGKVTPVAELEPVDILDTTVQRATFHNANILRSFKVSKGCEVFVVKAHDIIPAIIDVRNSDLNNLIDTHPTVCPECGFELEEGYCSNELCVSKLSKRIVHMSEKTSLDIPGLSHETAKKMVSEADVKTLGDVFGLTEQQIQNLTGFGKHSGHCLYVAIQKARKAPLSNFITSAGVPSVGEKTSYDLAKHHKNYESFIQDIRSGAKESMLYVPRVGEHVRENLYNYRVAWMDLRKFVTPLPMDELPEKAPNEQYTFVITGTFSVDRRQLKNMIKQAGHKVTDSVSRKTTYLVAGEKCGSKLTKAKELGIEIIDEQGLHDLII